MMTTDGWSKEDCESKMVDQGAPPAGLKSQGMKAGRATRDLYILQDW